MLPIGLLMFRWCWLEDIYPKLLHGIASVASPLGCMRKSNEIALRYPRVPHKSWRTGSLQVSKPCLDCYVQRSSIQRTTSKQSYKQNTARKNHYQTSTHLTATSCAAQPCNLNPCTMVATPLKNSTAIKSWPRRVITKVLTTQYVFSCHIYLYIYILYIVYGNTHTPLIT